MKLYQVKNIYYTSYKGIKPRKEEIVIITVCDDSAPHLWIPSKLTGYIQSKYNRNELSTQYNYALTITAFMNFIIEEIAKNDDDVFLPLKEQGLYGLKHIHLARFINYVSTRSKRSNNMETVDKKEARLVEFYDYLYRAGITGDDAKIESYEDFDPRTKKIVRRLVSPLEDDAKYPVHYPAANNKVSNVLRNMDKEVWNTLLDYAEEYYPHIVFGITLQIMGGLRRGEVVNIIIPDVTYNEEDETLTIWLQERPGLFSNRNIATRKSRHKKKKPRRQVIYDFNGRLVEIYEKHKKYIAQNANENGRRLKALFINDDGDPMSGNTYENQFVKLKKEFLNVIYDKKPSLFNQLNEARWGSHIGRHIFTNFLIDEGLVNDAQGNPDAHKLQLNRGDDSRYSSEDYVDTKIIFKGTAKQVNMMSKSAKSLIKSHHEKQEDE